MGFAFDMGPVGKFDFSNKKGKKKPMPSFKSSNALHKVENVVSAHVNPGSFGGLKLNGLGGLGGLGGIGGHGGIKLPDIIPGGGILAKRTTPNHVPATPAPRPKPVPPPSKPAFGVPVTRSKHWNHSHYKKKHNKPTQSLPALAPESVEPIKTVISLKPSNDVADIASKNTPLKPVVKSGENEVAARTFLMDLSSDVIMYTAAGTAVAFGLFLYVKNF